MKNKTETKGLIKNIREIIQNLLSGLSPWKPNIKQKPSEPDAEKGISEHTKYLKYLLNDSKGREQLVDYLIHEVALQGVINEVIEQMATETPLEKIKKDFVQEEPDIEKETKKVSRWKSIGAGLFKKVNSIIPTIISGK